MKLIYSTYNPSLDSFSTEIRHISWPIQLPAKKSEMIRAGVISMPSTTSPQFSLNQKPVQALRIGGEVS